MSLVKIEQLDLDFLKDTYAYVNVRYKNDYLGRGISTIVGIIGPMGSTTNPVNFEYQYMSALRKVDIFK